MPTSPSALCEVLRGSPDSLGAAAHLIVEYCMQMLAAVRVGVVYRTPPSSSFQLLTESKPSIVHTNAMLQAAAGALPVRGI